MKQESILARVFRPTTKRIRVHTPERMRQLRKAFGFGLRQYLPSPFAVVRSEESFIARVPVVMTTVPETPEVITIGQEVFVRVTESPLSYREVLAQKAVRQR